MIVKPFELDKSKVKRLFVFGCSFTSYFWPTWANIIAKELEHSEFYNFAISGLGNLGIASRLSEANNRFNFCETDLVIVMWTTFLREDRWLPYRWYAAGNVYSSGEMYPKDFTDKYSNACGYLIRDCALITMANQLLETSKCQSLALTSVPLDHLDCNIDIDKNTYNKILDLYQPLFDKMPKNLFDFVKVGNRWPVSFKYLWENDIHHDHHPLPMDYFRYLQTYVIDLSEKTEQYVQDVTQKMSSFTTKHEIGTAFEYDTKEYLLF